MEYGTECHENRARIEVFGKEYFFRIDEKLLGLCAEIRNDAKEKLDHLCRSGQDAEDILAEVGSFLTECLKKIIGESIFEEISENRELSVQELSGLLCYALSEIRTALEVDGVLKDE